MTAMPRASQILLVGQRIRQLRKSRHLTQADLASRIGIAQSDLSRMENGEYKVGLDTLFRILQVFELSMSNFFEEASPEAEESGSNPETHSELASAGGAPARDERDQLISDWTELSDESRREVREFISFKRMQADSRRPLLEPKWKPESAEAVSALKASEMPQGVGSSTSLDSETSADINSDINSAGVSERGPVGDA